MVIKMVRSYSSEELGNGVRKQRLKSYERIIQVTKFEALCMHLLQIINFKNDSRKIGGDYLF